MPPPETWSSTPHNWAHALQIGHRTLGSTGCQPARMESRHSPPGPSRAVTTVPKISTFAQRERSDERTGEDGRQRQRGVRHDVERRHDSRPVLVRAEATACNDGAFSFVIVVSVAMRYGYATSQAVVSSGSVYNVGESAYLAEQTSSLRTGQAASQCVRRETRPRPQGC